MRSLTVVLGVLLATLPAPAQQAGTTPRVPGLELPEPQTVSAGSGYVKLKAKADAPVGWDVFAVFADPSVKVQWDDLGDGTLIVGIPATAGALRIVAGVSGGDGKTPPRLASTLITITPLKGNDGEGGSGVSTGRPVLPSKLNITFLGAEPSASLRKTLEDAGNKVWTYSAGDPRLQKRPDLEAELARIGGLPALIVQDQAGKGQGARLPSGDEAVLQLITQLSGGK